MKKSVLFLIALGLVLIAFLALTVTHSMAITLKPTVSIDLDALTVNGIGFEPSGVGTIDQLSSEKAVRDIYDFEVGADGTFELKLADLQSGDTMNINLNGKQVAVAKIPQLNALADLNTQVITGSGPGQSEIALSIEESGSQYEGKAKTNATGSFSFSIPKNWKISSKAEGIITYKDKAGNGFTSMVTIPHFSDVPSGHWALTDLERLSDWGALSGFSDGSIRPDATVTRAQLAKMLLKSLNENESTTHAGAFSDIPATSWSWPYVESASNLGLIKGYQVSSGIEFRPENVVSRAELAAILVRAAGLQGEADRNKNAKTKFVDDTGIPNWARGYVAVATSHGILEGLSGKVFASEKPVTRAQAAVAIVRLITKD